MDIVLNGKFSKTKGHNCGMHGAIWTIIKLEEDIMVQNNVTKFHKILIKSIQLREQKSLGLTYARMYGWTDGQR